ncbi:MAG TPA: hypothetical protein VFD48_18220, partial [Pyrinomonadaceae bacterium]|nr:hypothetical protein [Pyrinomonadaceae bacterium]
GRPMAPVFFYFQVLLRHFSYPLGFKENERPLRGGACGALQSREVKRTAESPDRKTLRASSNR